MSQLDPKVEAVLQKVGNKYGLPREVWYPIVMSESGGSPTARASTSTEDSRGLFQVNIFAHPDANSVRLYDPEYNAEYMMPELKRVYDEGITKGLSGVELTKYVERYGERPKWTEDVSRNIEHYYDSMTKPDSMLGNIQGQAPNNANISAFSATDPTTWFPAVKSSLAYVGFEIFIVLILLFSLYMVFIRNTTVEKIGYKVGSKLI